jgi:hypothetical protein
MSDTAPDGAPAPEGTPDPAPAGDTPDLAAELEKWKGLARKHETRAKENATAATELEKLRQASMSDTEKAVALAVEQTKHETLKLVGGRLVDAEVRTVLAGRGVDADALLDGLDRSRFLGDDGEPDTAGIAAWVERIAPKRDASGFDIGQGARGNGNGTTDLAGDAFERMLVAKVGKR